MGDALHAPATGMDLAEATDEQAPKAKRIAEAHGLTVEHVVDVERTSEIDGAANTVYDVAGPLTHDGRIDIGGTDDTAIVGTTDDARLVIPAKNREYDLRVGGGIGFLWWGVDLDQREPGAWGRLHGACAGSATFKNFETLGSGRRANPDPSSRLDDKSGAFLYAPATDENGTNYVVNVENDHAGVFDDRHFGDRPIGLWLGGEHEGTLCVRDCVLTGFPNNAIYASAAPGPVEVERCDLSNNGVTNGRIAHGHFKHCAVEVDCEDSPMDNPDAPDHATVGLAAEQKNAGANGKPGPDVIDCLVMMANVGKGGTGLRAYDIHQPADWGVIEGTDIHIGSGAGDYAADIELRGDVEAIRDCGFSGSNDQHASILNRSGQPVTVEGGTWDYPDGRGRDKGDEVGWR